MSTHVVGFKPPDGTWFKMRTVYYACKDAGIKIPAEVQEFFGDEAPDPAGVEVDLSHCILPYQDDMKDGYELDLSRVPEHVTTIRFWNSY